MVRNFVRNAVAAAAMATLCSCSSYGAPGESVGSPNAAVGKARTPAPTEILYVDDHRNAVVIFGDRRWRNGGSITNGIDAPSKNWVDANGNLYVANGQNVTEYAPGSSSPSFTYTNGLQSPVDVTTDSAGNVYEADLSAQSVVEFQQNSNTVLAACGPAEAEIQSFAVDRSDDVFVAYFGTQAHIMEYRKGLIGCQSRLLAVALGYPGGMALDKNNNLLVCDGTNVDVIKPPYHVVSGILGRSYGTPTSVRINQRNDEAYVVDCNARKVFIIRYPGGLLIKQLSSKNGLYEPTGAVDSQNFNP